VLARRRIGIAGSVASTQKILHGFGNTGISGLAYKTVRIACSCFSYSRRSIRSRQRGIAQCAGPG
jgi:hypothetical protein